MIFTIYGMVDYRTVIILYGMQYFKVNTHLRAKDLAHAMIKIGERMIFSVSI